MTKYNATRKFGVKSAAKRQRMARNKEAKQVSDKQFLHSTGIEFLINLNQEKNDEYVTRWLYKKKHINNTFWL